jgi:hypothetical protein
MKTKYKHTGNIEKEKLRLRVKQLELEKQIRREWHELKGGFAPKGFSSTHDCAGTDRGLFSEVVNHGVKYIINHLTVLAGQQIEAGLKKSFTKFSEKLKNLFSH